MSKKRGDFGLLFFLCIINQKILSVIAILNTSKINKTSLSEENVPTKLQLNSKPWIRFRVLHEQPQKLKLGNEY